MEEVEAFEPEKQYEPEEQFDKNDENDIELDLDLFKFDNNAEIVINRESKHCITDEIYGEFKCKSLIDQNVEAKEENEHLEQNCLELESKNEELYINVEIDKIHIAQLVKKFDNTGRIIESFKANVDNSQEIVSQLQHEMNKSSEIVKKHCKDLNDASNYLNEQIQIQNQEIQKYNESFGKRDSRIRELLNMNSFLKDELTKKQQDHDELIKLGKTLTDNYELKSNDLKEILQSLEFYKDNIHKTRTNATNFMKGKKEIIEELYKEEKECAIKIKNLISHKEDLNHKINVLKDNKAIMENNILEFEAKNEQLENEIGKLKTELENTKQLLEEKNKNYMAEVQETINQYKQAEEKLKQVTREKEEKQNIIKALKLSYLVKMHVKNDLIVEALRPRETLQNLRMEFVKNKHLITFNDEKLKEFHKLLKQLKDNNEAKNEEILEYRKKKEILINLEKENHNKIIKNREKQLKGATEKRTYLINLNKYFTDRIKQLQDDLNEDFDCITKAKESIKDNQKLHDELEDFKTQSQKLKMDCKKLSEKKRQLQKKTKQPPVPKFTPEKKVTFNERLHYKSASESTMEPQDSQDK